MERASKNVLFTIAMNLELPNLLRWCASNGRINKDVCQNNDVWRSKLMKDYPDYQKFQLNRSLRETYVFLYQLSYIKSMLVDDESLYDIYLRKEIDWSGEGLKKVPAFDLPNLVHLDLLNNNLIEVPTFTLPNLKTLNLNNNLLIRIPRFDLPNLRVLDLSNNQLTQIPAFDLPNLEHLHLGNNSLTNIPGFDLPNLQVLDLYNNKLAEVPKFDLPNLKQLDLSGNRLTEIDKEELKEKYKSRVQIYL